MGMLWDYGGNEAIVFRRERITLVIWLGMRFLDEKIWSGTMLGLWKTARKIGKDFYSSYAKSKIIESMNKN